MTSPSERMLQAVKNYYGLRSAREPGHSKSTCSSYAGGWWRLETCNTDTLLFVGRFDGLKGGDLMLRVFAELARRIQSCGSCLSGRIEA